ncbi:MAG: tRNA (adenosine(37)-N6)-threonylcarbamoyltransferase complex transferase subunit TsaD [Bacteroidota bacterium]
MQKIILAIESSCDETSIAIIKGNKLLSHVITNQKIHADYGGVVPELASRYHQKNIVNILQQALQKANLTLNQLHAIAFTQGPGLLGSLLVGSCFAKGLAYSLSLPLIAVHHIKAHVLANFIEDPKPNFPFLALIVSGGHTQLIHVKDYFDMTLLGQTKDDAIGEAFDKIAKTIHLPYPGGIWIDRYAQQGNPQTFTFPTTKVPGLDFSFSGIKTAFSQFIQKNNTPSFIQENRYDICASIQEALINILINKVDKALEITSVDQVVLGGGVAANSALRKKMYTMGQEKGFQLFVPRQKYCTDNAAMIAITAYYQLKIKDFSNYKAPALAKMNI